MTISVEAWGDRERAIRNEMQFDAAPVAECTECGTIWNHEERGECPGCHPTPRDDTDR